MSYILLWEQKPEESSPWCVNSMLSRMVDRKVKGKGRNRGEGGRGCKKAKPQNFVISLRTSLDQLWLTWLQKQYRPG